RVRRHPNLRRGKAAKRRGVWIRERMIGRDEARRRTRRDETARSVWRKFVVRFGIHIIEIAKKPQLIVADFVLESRITAPALLSRPRARIQVEVKPRQNATPYTSRVINIIARRAESIGIIRRRAENCFSRC